MTGLNGTGKAVLDVAAFGVLGATLVKWLPAVAALFTIVWTSIRIYETRTVQCVIARVRGKQP